MIIKPLKRIKTKFFPGDGKTLLSDRLSKKLDLGYTYEDDSFNAIQVIKGNTMIPYEQLVSLYEQVVYCEKNNVPGCIVECGVWKAGASGLMALANLKFGNERRDIYLLDAFDDICEPDELHDEKKLVAEVKNAISISAKTNFDGKLRPLSGIYDKWGGHGTLQEAQHLLEKVIKYPSNHVFYVKGWFQETLPIWENKISDIAILRLDGDWYESTKICMEKLYPKLVKGGICIIDDYGYNSGCRKAVHEYLDKHNENPLMGKVEYLRYWIKL